MTSKLTSAFQTIRGILTPEVTPTQNGKRRVWRIGQGSVALGIYGQPERDLMTGVGYLNQRHGLAHAIYGSTSAVGMGIGVSFDPTTWVEYDEWVKNRGNIDAARECCLFFTREMVLWRWWRKPVPRSPYVRNERADGHATWARVILGRRIEKTRHEKHAVTIPLPEGSHKAEFRLATTTVHRERFPLRAWTETAGHVSVDHGIPVPSKDRESLDHYFTVKATLCVDAVREVVESVTAKRATVPKFTPAVRVRRKSSAAEPTRLWPYSVAPAPTSPTEACAWERRDVLTGKWTDLGTMTRAELPAGVLVEHDPLSLGTIALLGMTGIVGMGFAALMGGRADRDRF